ncbi:MAG: DUF58 domain-containing protein [Clostridia bacterium]|nr:DUF58 domain-containing protein [Clostridia bacterium]
MTLPKSLTKIIVYFSLLLILSIFTANMVIFILAVLTFLLLGAAFIFPVPKEIKIWRSLSSNKLQVGDVLLVTVNIEVSGGLGIVAFEDVVPPYFELVEGSNCMTCWKEVRDQSFSFQYKFKCLVSGNHEFNILKWELRHFLYEYAKSGEMNEPSKVDVIPGMMDVKKIMNLKNKSPLPLPSGAQANIGLATLDLKDMRFYTPGDHFRNINWKATSRNIYKGIPWPVVNEYEKEGKKNIWIFIDRAPEMKMGSNVRNVMECAIEAANSLANYYLSMDCLVGFSTFNCLQTTVLPGEGRKQYHRIRKELVKLTFTREKRVEEFYEKCISLKEAVKTNTRYICGSRPLFIIITSFDRGMAGMISDGIQEMMKYAGNTERKPKIMVINIVGYGLISKGLEELTAQKLLYQLDRFDYAFLKKKCIWIDWEPASTSLAKVLLTQVRKL